MALTLSALALALLAPAASAQLVGNPAPDTGEGGTGNDQATQQLPDRLVYQAGTKPARPHEEAPFEACVEIQNYGNGKPGPFSVALVWDDEDPAYERYQTFPDEGAEFCVELTADAGEHAFQVFVDVEEEVMERDESNNEQTVRVRVSEKPLPDIAVNFTVTPDPPRRGESLVLKANLRNVGPEVAGNFSVRFYIEDVLLVERQVPEGLYPGYRYDTAFTMDADVIRQGNWTVRAVVDEDGWLREMNEDNNVDARVIHVPRLPRPELAVNEYDAAHTVREGEVLNVTAEVRNFGDKAAGGFVVRFLLDNETTIGLPRVENLAPLTSVNVSTSWAAREPGTHFVRIIVDANHEVAEDSGRNNERNFTLTITPRDTVIPRPDLVVERILTSPFPAKAGEPVTLTAVAHNQGSIASPPVNLSFNVNGERVNVTRTAELTTGGYLAYSTTWNGTAGEHAVTVVLDEDDAVTELNEENNSKTTTFRVLPADHDPDARPDPRPGDGNGTAPDGDGDGVGSDDGEGSDGDAGGGGNTADPVDRVLDRDEEPVVVLEVTQAGYLDRVQGEPDPRLVGRVVNRGNAVSPPFIMEFWLDGVKVGEREAPGLGPERDLVLSWGAHVDENWTRPAVGDHDVRVTVIEEGESAPAPLADKSQSVKVNALEDDEKAVPSGSLLVALACVGVLAAALGRRE